jgi:hypothetical protein
MAVYGLLTDLTYKTLTLWRCGEGDDVPKDRVEKDHTATYYSDIDEARRIYNQCVELMRKDGYTFVDET